MSNLDLTKLITAEEKAASRPAELIAYLANKRWQVETGGMTIEGAKIRTDEVSQAKLGNAVQLVQMNPDTVIDWSAENGFVQLDAATITAVAVAVGTFVQGCFSVQKSLTEDIESGVVTSEAEIDAAFAILQGAV